ncbi:MAG: tyrosine-type recombinase/integrase [bacterium]|nr:tyrosine-type recombinase/integrase [bacterium]
MLQQNITNFLDYCNNSDFSKRSIETLSFRLNEFDKFVQTHSISSIDKIKYQHLLQFVADYGTPSPSVKKARVWCLRQFFHYLKLQQLVDKNIALELPYPKMEKKVAKFLTEDEFNRILNHFTQKATDIHGLRNLIIILIMGLLGIRTAAIVAVNINDVDLAESRLWIHEKGYQQKTKKTIPLPQVLCQVLNEYIKQLNPKQKPLFMSKRNKRYASRSLQNLFRNVADKLGINKKLHPHLFRHTAATQINKVAGLQITQFVLGHQSIANTDHYAHLNPDIYAVHMKKHPYMTFDL